MTQYIIVRKDFRNAFDMEANKPYRVANLGFNPMSLKDAQTILSKCMNRDKLSANQIIPV